MLVLRIFHEPHNWQGDDPVALWEEYMQEPWSDYDGADRFVVVDGSDIVGGFAVYWDESDDIEGNFCSGWAARHRGVPTAAILQQLASTAGDIYFKTDKRAAKFLLEKIGKKVKNTESFSYYIVRGNDNGKAEKNFRR